MNFDSKIDLEKAIIRMCRNMQHRGPDDEGIYISENQDFTNRTVSPSQVGLGHRRLSIIDLSSAGHQPMCNEDENIWLIFNGEIYNFQDLRSQLETRGHQFRSRTDAEVIIHLYEDFAEDCVHHLYGMFAFAIWDGRLSQLLLARDRVGKKPLNYFYHNNRFVFASEFSALLASGLIKPEIDLESIDLYFTLGYICAPYTAYKDIFKLPPGNILTFKDRRLSIRQYWKINHRKKCNISEKEAQDKLIGLLEDSVKIRLYSDVPIGAFLSGGIDSSAVVGMMSKILGKNVKTFSIGFDERHFNELNFARKIAKLFETDHHEFIVKPDALKVLSLLIERYGEPYADPSAIPTYYVSKLTKQYVTVALNGDGGDESFAGYERYQAAFLGEYYRKLTTPILRKAINNIMEIIPGSQDRRTVSGILQRLFKAISQPPNKCYFYLIEIFDEDDKRKIYNQDFLKGLPSNNNPLYDYYNKVSDLNLIDRFLSIDVNFYLPDDLLVKVDIASMANSLELRSPFLDHRLMEFAASLPAHFKMRNLVKKYILKEMLKGFLPQKNIHRRKMGFGVPIGKWFRSELKNFVQDILLSQSFLKKEYLNSDGIKNMLFHHINGYKDYSFQLWTLLMFELWHRRFIENDRMQN